MFSHVDRWDFIRETNSLGKFDQIEPMNDRSNDGGGKRRLRRKKVDWWSNKSDIVQSTKAKDRRRAEMRNRKDWRIRLSLLSLRNKFFVQNYYHWNKCYALHALHLLQKRRLRSSIERKQRDKEFFSKTPG